MDITVTQDYLDALDLLAPITDAEWGEEEDLPDEALTVKKKELENCFACDKRTFVNAEGFCHTCN